MPRSPGRRRYLLAFGALALAFGAAAVSLHVTLPRTLRVVDARGRPLPDAWVAYHFRGHRFATVESLLWERPGSLRRTDEDGLLELPARVHVRVWPLLTGPERVLDVVYVPALHNATAPLGPAGRPGRVAVEGERVVVADLTADPVARADTIAQLFSFLRYDLLGNHADRWVRVRPGTASDLANAITAEYASFHRDWGHTPRPLPVPPAGLQQAGEAERRSWEATIAAHLGAEPLWGPFMERLWKAELRELRELAARQTEADAAAAP